MNYYSEFFKDKPELELSFRQLSTDFDIPVERKLKAITDETEFLAAIIEFRFGVLFSALSYTLFHDRIIFPESPLKPDWTIICDQETIVAEVVRLNPSLKDSQELEFSDNLMETLQSIEENFFLELDYDYTQVSALELDHDDIKSLVIDWLKPERAVGDQVVFYGLITLTVVQKNTNITHVCVVGAFSTINFDYRRLYGENSRLFSKLKYADAVQTHNYPFIICMHLSFESWFKPEELYEKLYGQTCSFHHHEPFEEYYPEVPFQMFMNGLFYSNESFRNSVSGIIAYYQGEFTFFPNYAKSNRLSQRSLDFLNCHLYKDLKH